MSIPVGIIVEKANPREFDEVRDLIIRGLAERWMQYDPARNPDLQSFHDCYSEATVVVAKDKGQIIGCGILVRLDDQTAKIVRMSVTTERRREGIGSRILRSLLDHAKELGVKQIVLETTATWHSAVSFYDRQGFIRTGIIDDDQHFRLALNDI